MRVTIKGKMAAVAALSAAALVLSGCGGGTEAASTGSATSGEVNLIAYSGVWQDQYTAAVVEPFKAKYPDIKINYSSKRSSAEMLSALQGQKNNPATDVAIMDNSVSTTGNKQGLFKKVDEESVPNLANVPEKFQDKEGYGPVAMLDAVGLELVDVGALRELDRYAADRGATVLLRSPPILVQRLLQLLEPRAVRLEPSP